MNTLNELKESMNRQSATIDKLLDEREEVIACFQAAVDEGLLQALQETTDMRLKDLVERRLLHALYAMNK